MKIKATKTKSSATLNNLDKRMNHLEKTMATLNMTVDNLAEATAKGFANTVSKNDFNLLKKDFEDLGDRIERTLETYTKDFRADYDVLTSRVKRLEVAVFKH